MAQNYYSYVENELTQETIDEVLSKQLTFHLLDNVIKGLVKRNPEERFSEEDLRWHIQLLKSHHDHLIKKYLP